MRVQTLHFSSAARGLFIRHRTFAACLAAAMLLMTAVSCGRDSQYGYSPEVRRILEELDSTLKDKDAYAAAKNSEIEKIKSGLEDAAGTDIYRIYDRLYDEYYQYNIDSAITYARKKQAIANETGNAAMIYDSMLDLADRYVLSGMFAEALSVMSKIGVDNLDEKYQPRYYHIYNSLYNGMRAASDDPVLRDEYTTKRDFYRKRAVFPAGTGSARHNRRPWNGAAESVNYKSRFYTGEFPLRRRKLSFFALFLKMEGECPR